MNPQNKPHPHAELIHAWADGKTIQIRLKESQEKWKDLPDSGLPLFNDKHFEYRIKPSNEPWKPASGIKYYYVTDLGFAFSATWQSRHIDNCRYSFNNCFRLMDEAEAAIPRVKAALKGDFATTNVDIEKLKVWATENDIAGGLQLTVGELKERFRKLSKENEQLKIRNANLIHSKEVLSANQFTIDGKPLSDGEKALIKALRESTIDDVFKQEKSTLVYTDKEGDIKSIFQFVAFTTEELMTSPLIISALEQLKKEQEASGEA